ncbi:MAG: efflux RND transporter periplasmic adaptor subunit, partial [Bdellovibrionales bacterium]|nr:efflux RND transporter periplasmic adaptor subunit [Bdellovibrionales bacterium]
MNCRLPYCFVAATWLLTVNSMLVHAESPAEEQHHDHDEHGHREIVSMTDETREEFGITTRRAGPGTLEMNIAVPGEIVPNRDTLSHISPRFPGIAQEVRKNVGDSVRQGDVLAIIESNSSLTSYKLTALLDGTVIEKHITRGEMLSETDIAFIVADLNTVWVNLSVYQTDLPLVHTGQQVHLSLGHHQSEAQ